MAPPKPAKGQPTKARPSPAPAKPAECDMCRALQNAYKDVPLQELRKHCGRHPVTPDAMTANPLPQETHPAIRRYEPETLPDDYRPFVEPWDGSIRPVWASAWVRVPPPQSPAWEHLIEWAADVRKNHRRLTVGAVALLLRQHLIGDEDAIRRLYAIYADEYAAEKRFRRQGETQTVAAMPPPPPPPPVVLQPAKPKEALPPPSKDEPVAKAKRPVKTGEGRDAWGYRAGTRSHAINAWIMAHPTRWVSSREIERLTRTTSASSHLSSLVRDGHVEFKRDEGTREGKYRLKAKK